MIKKIIAILLAAALLLLAGCSSGKGENTDDPSVGDNGAAPTGELQLLYCAADTMNPYNTISKLNAELATLIFDPLYKVDNSFEAVAVLSKDAVFEDDTCTVTLRDARFSDGSPVTAEDVVFSYNLAKESDRFSYLFYEIETVAAADSHTIVFTLNKNDPYFTKLLTFPILKVGSDQLKDEDNVELVPIGCGRFIFDKSATALIPNTQYFGTGTEISKIKLINAPDYESMEHYVEIGATDIYYAEMKDDTIIRMSGKKTEVNLNNLIYLGVNHYYGPLRSAELRYAISSALSREQIAKKAFHSNATPATGFFHPLWKDTADYQTIQTSANLKISIENLANIGYNKLNAEGYYENSAGRILELGLLVNNESSAKIAAAELVVNQLKSTGIKVNLNIVDKSEYFRALSSGQFQLYLGEVRLLPNMDISPLVISGGSAAYGMPHTIASMENVSDEGSDADNSNPPAHDIETSYISVVKGYANGINTVADTASALLASMPLIPIAYRNSIVFYSAEIEDIGEASACDVFLSVDNIKIKK